jgi:spore maturation protein CgeB
MIRRIDFFMPPPNQYERVSYLTKELYQAFQRQGVNCRLLVGQRENPEPFLSALFQDPPDCTFSFNGLLPDNQGNFFCEMIKIPHIAYLMDSPIQFLSLAKSSLNIVLCPDIFACNFFLGLNFNNVIFIPHGVSKDIRLDISSKRRYEVVMLSSCIDYEEIRIKWKNKYTLPLYKVLENASERSMSNPTISLVESLVAELNEQLGKSNAINPSEINLLELLDELETYIRGKDRVEAVRAVKDCQVDVFGAPKQSASWEKYLKGCNAVIHDPIPYEQALNVMKESKIVLTSCPWTKNGGDERIFAAFACGAMVISSDNVYLRHHFNEGTEILFYQPGKWTRVNDLVQEYLSKPSSLEQIADNGKRKTLKEHTWDVRAKNLLNQLPPLLEKIKIN